MKRQVLTVLACSIALLMTTDVGFGQTPNYTMASENFNGTTAGLPASGWSGYCILGNTTIVDAAAVTPPAAFSANVYHTYSPVGDRALGFYKTANGNPAQIQFVYTATRATSNINMRFDFEVPWQRFNGAEGFRAWFNGSATGGYQPLYFKVNAGAAVGFTTTPAITPIIQSNGGVPATTYLTDAQMDANSLSLRNLTYSFTGLTLNPGDQLTIVWDANYGSGSNNYRVMATIDNFLLEGYTLPVYNVTQNLEYATIQAAIDAAASGDVIEVAAGTYNENVTVNKRLTLDGDGPASTIIQSAAGTTPVMTVTASGLDASNRLVIRDLKVTGATGGENPGAGILVQSTSPQSFLTIDNVVSQGNQGAGIAFNSTAAVTDVIISHSSMLNSGNAGLRIASAVPSFDGLVVSNCVVQGSASSGFSYNPNGVLTNVGTNFTFTDCSFINNSTANVTNQHDLSFHGFHGNVTMTNVTVNSGNGVGQNSSSYGISFTNASAFAPAGTMVLNNVTCTGHVGKAALGFQFYSDVSGISLNNVNVAGCVAPWGQLIVYHNDSDPFPVGNTAVRDLRMWWSGGADASMADFRHISTGVPLNRNVLADAFQISSQVADGVDVAGAGLIRIKTGEMFVTAGTSIQRAVNLATSGDKVNVAAGTFDEDVTVNKPLHVQGAGAGLSTVRGPIGGGGSTFRLDASNVELDGFTITRLGNNPTDWNLDLNTAGIAIQGQGYAGNNVHHNSITGNRTGIDLNDTSGHQVQNNVIDNNRTGMILRNQTDNLTVTGNSIAGNWTAGVVFLDGSLNGSNVPPQQALGSLFSGNSISNNWYGQVVERQAGGSLPLPGTNLKQFPGNWWGTATPWVSTANSTEPGYAAQIPVVFGGTATAPGGQPDILGPASANIVYTPLLNNAFAVTQTVVPSLISVADGPDFTDDAIWQLAIQPAAAPVPGWRMVVVDLAWDTTKVSVGNPTNPFSHTDGVVWEFERGSGTLQVSIAITGTTLGQSAATNLFQMVVNGTAEPLAPYTTPLTISNVRVYDVANPPVQLAASWQAPLALTVDGTGPVTTAGWPGATCVNANFTVALSALDNVALDRLQWNFNNTTWTDVTGATGLPGTSYGPLPFIADISGLTNNSSHTIYFRGKDDVGNYGAAISWTFYKDATAPSAATNFDADPRHGGCQLDWTAATGHAGYTLYWKKRAGYPYPTGSMSLAWNGDTLTADGLTALAAGVTSYPFPTPIGYGDRGVYDFVLVAKDCVNTPAASAMASATNYFLGDVAGTPTYDGRINMPDLLVMGTHYGTSPTTDPAREMNIGPTHNGSCYGLPNGGTTRINFEDLIIFAMNYGESGPELPNTVATSTTPVVELRRDGESWQLVLTGQLKGFSARIETEAVLQEATADFPVFFYREGNAWLVDAVSLSGMLVDGSSVTLRFTGDNAVTLASVDGRDANNNVRPVEALSEVVDLPTQFALEQNYPNPFNPTTTIRYALPEAASVKLAVYNALGQEVAVLVQGSQTAGFHEARLDGSGLASGVYVYRLEAGRYTDQKKLVLVK